VRACVRTRHLGSGTRRVPSWWYGCGRNVISSSGRGNFPMSQKLLNVASSSRRLLKFQRFISDILCAQSIPWQLFPNWCRGRRRRRRRTRSVCVCVYVCVCVCLFASVSVCLCVCVCDWVRCNATQVFNDDLCQLFHCTSFGMHVQTYWLCVRVCVHIYVHICMCKPMCE